MARFEQSRVARGRAFALCVAVAFAGACGDDSGDKGAVEDSGGGNNTADASKPDAAQARDAAADGGSMDATTRDAGTDAGRDAAVDAGTLVTMPDGMDMPVISTVGFYTADSAFPNRILIAGSDKNGDVASYTVSWFSDVNGMTPVSIHANGVSTDPATPSVTANVEHNMMYQDFMVHLEPSGEVFDGTVKSIKVTVTDKGGRTTEAKLAKLGAAPMAGSSCDPLWGFNICAKNSVCAPQNNGNYACTTEANARTMACSAANVLSVTAPGSVDGTLNNASFWDAPPGCVGATTELNDRVVKVTVTADGTKLTLAPGPNPTFDMGIYQLPAPVAPMPVCSASPTTACPNTGCPTCSDTGASGPLVLQNVAKGDYYFVIERFPTELNGNTFTLNVTTN